MKEDTIKLVKRAIKGNMDAYGKLIAEYQIYLYKTAFLYVKNEADSLDAVQECVIKGMLGIEKLREPRYFKNLDYTDSSQLYLAGKENSPDHFSGRICGKRV